MILVYIVSGLVLFTFFNIQIFSLWAMARIGKNCHHVYADDTPAVSILLAARNEEKLILRSLQHLDKLDYPKDKLQILIGNDDSTDSTAALIKDFIQDKPNFQLLNVKRTLGKARAKANVLAHLAHKATGDYYFITDVDVAVPRNWVRNLLAAFEPKVGIVSGTTKCERTTPFAKLQGIDWLHFMGYIKAFASVGIGCTSVGNNMAVRAKAYLQTGGYEHIDFSITEDYKLFKEVTNRGWEWRNILHSDSLGLATHIPQAKEMLFQRKRWLIGAQELPWNWKSMIFIYGLFYPVWILLLAINLWLGVLLWVIKFAIQTLFINLLFRSLERKKPSIVNHFIYEIYVIINTIATAIFYLLPIKTKWKDRTY